MSLENLPATKRLYWWRTHRPLTVRFWRTPGEELTPNLHPGPPGSTRSPRPARWPPWPCFQNVATPPSYAYLRLDAGTHLGTSCPPWTLTTTTCLSSLRPLPSPPCLVRAELTQTWACGDSVVLINTMVCPQPFPFWVGVQRYEATKIDLRTTFWDEHSQCWVICGLKSLPEAFRTVFWGPHQFRMIQLCSGVNLQIHHTHFFLSSSSLLSVASLPDAEQQLLCECCCHGYRELSAAHQHHLFFLSHLRLTDIIQMTFQTLPLWHGVKYRSVIWWNDSGWSVL